MIRSGDMGAKLILSRESQFANKFRSYQVLVDNEVIGEIKDGETKNFDLPLGEHIIELKIDWCLSKAYNLNIQQNDPFTFRCGSRLKGLKNLKASMSTNKEVEFVYLEKIN